MDVSPDFANSKCRVHPTVLAFSENVLYTYEFSLRTLEKNGLSSI